jgi:hypothetical protein
LRDAMEDDLSNYKKSISSSDLPNHRKHHKIAEKELALFERLIEKAKEARNQSDAKYLESKKK